MMEPSNVKELRSYLGCFGYYRKFISNFSQIAEPLYSLLKKGTKFNWSTKQQKAFDTLKTRLATAPVLALPVDDAQIVVDCDASDTGVGAVLSMILNGEEKPICYASRTYSQQETNWCITRREMLAMIYALKQFRQYCLGRNIIVRTDHAPLVTFQTTPSPSSQICRWLDLLAEYDIEIQHRPGLRHGNADGCSRTHTTCKQCKLSPESYLQIDADIVTRQKAGTSQGLPTEQENTMRRSELEHCNAIRKSGVTVDSINQQSPALDLGELQQKDPDIGPVYAALSSSTEQPDLATFNPESEDTKNLVTQWPRLTLVEGVLYREWLDARTTQTKWLQCIIPSEVKDTILQVAHTGMSGGHLGIRKTTAQIHRRAYWRTWRKDVARFVRRCPQCASYRRSKAPRLGELQNLQVGSPMERVGIDLTGPWPKSDGNVYILTFIDHFTKWADAIPIPNKEAATVAQALVSKIFTHVGCPLQILSDQGKEFDCHLLKNLCNALGIDKIRTTPYKASTNGTAERLHRTINGMCAKMVSDNQRNWSEVLPHIMAAYRSAVHESTGFTPNFLFFGREVHSPIDLMTQPPPDESSIEDFVDQVAFNIQYAHQCARDTLKTQTLRRKRLYDMRVNSTSFQRHDWVWYYYPRRYSGKSPKWQRFYNGPFLVLDRIGPVTYRIQKSAKADPLIVHVDKLKVYEGKTPTSWLLQPTSNLRLTENDSNVTINVPEEVVIDSVQMDFSEQSEEPVDNVLPLANDSRQKGRPKRQPTWLADYLQY